MFVFEGNNGKRAELESGNYGDALKALGQLKQALAARVGEEAFDLSHPVEGGGKIEPITADSEEGLDILRHSAAHLMAQAIERLWPGTKFGVGPSIKDGFYYDVDLESPLTEEDLPKIEEEMRNLAREALPLTRREMGREEALSFFRSRKDPYKMELIEELETPHVSVYTQGDYSDLCRGPHVPDTSSIKHFKLLSVAGAYWRGDEKNKMLTRIYGTAFAKAEELKEHLKRLEEARARDHRKLGRELELFLLRDEGPGFPFFLPKGMITVNKLTEFWRLEHVRRGYSEIRTPLILNRSLWETSGHWFHYRENMYFTQIDENDYAIKPMNCPGGILVFKSKTRSYRDLPIRMAELGIVHRHERSGVLHGLMRVRCFTQDDAHIYCSLAQVKDEVIAIMDLCRYIYSNVFGFNYRMELSTRPENSMGDPEQWEAAENALKEALESAGADYKLNPGDGAFYGPKIDFHLEDCIGRTWQCGTIQLDFQLPERFDMNYIGQDGKEHRPVMLHRTVLGSLERFFGILIEHYAGAFPFWLAPVQVKILTVANEYLPWAREVMSQLQALEFRVEMDDREEKLGKKIRDAQMEKIPYMLVVGEKESAEKCVAVRERLSGDLGAMSLSMLLDRLELDFSPFKR
jgi:threonyl-tRNA synthetase